MGWALDTADGLVFQYLIPFLIAAFGMTLAQAGAIASANYFAAAIGGWLGGWLCDRYGRARILQITILWFSFFSFLSGFANSYEQLLVIRVLEGIGFGAEWAVGAVLLGEMINPAHRGKILGTVASGGAVGSGIAALLAGPVAAALPADYAWRVVFWLGIAPAVLVFFVRRGSDDSEVFKQARAHSRAVGRRVGLGSIFQPSVIRITCLAALLAVGAQGAGFAVSNYLTTFLHVERGLSTSVAGYCVLFNSLGGFFGFLVNAAVSDRIGRRQVFRLYGLGFIITSSIYLFGPWGNSLAVLMPLGAIYGFFQFGIYASFAPYFTELFPTEIRGTGQAFAYNFGRATSAVFIMGVAIVARSLPLSAAMAIMAILSISCAIIATLFLPETAGRKLQNLDDLAEASPAAVRAPTLAPPQTI
ncbi:MFS transporter [Sphingomonas sp.]|uniref:MFS transporter n=1 Tax=Sphingomonas sp. TaxID=28214 RepID=UPI0025EFC92D|nr:MFS transporter [Sphingomonas sp.]